MEKEFVTWEQVERFINEITAIGQSFTGVYGIPRGGLVIAVMISHRMNIPLLFSPIENCLIVDDICDSGESLLHYYRNSSAEGKPHYTIATMFYKENDLVVPNYYLYTKKDKWIVFPWEM